MSKAKMTMIGMYNYLIQQNTDLFSALVLPSDINKGEFKNALMLRAGEFETLYADPYFEREAIGIWGKKWYRTFEKWITALNIEYAPLENYDRMEDWTETENIDEDTTDNTNRTENEDITREEEETGTNTATGTTNTQTNTQGDSTTENTVSAFNSSNYEPDNKSINGVETDTTGSVVTSDETNMSHGSDSTENRKNEAEEKRTGTRDQDRTNHRTGRAHGNIGVTTSQQMLEAELNIAKWNLYDKMGDLFIQELLIPVYI